MIKKINSIAYFIIAIAVAMGILLWIAGADNDVVAEQLTDTTTSIVAEEPFFDFGTISMAAGIVTHEFKIKNIGNEDVIINKMYTSCMCTEATFIEGDTKVGPFGMPGHGFLPKIKEAIGSEEEATVRVDFDPAAHGPAGIGSVSRMGYLEQEDVSRPVELKFKVSVTP